MRSYWKIIMGSLNPGKSEKPITKSRKAKNTKKKWWDVCDFYIACFRDEFYFIDNAYSFRIKGYSRRSGETGRRTGLKIPRGQPRVGSIPTSGTNDNKGLEAAGLLSPFLIVLCEGILWEMLSFRALSWYQLTAFSLKLWTVFETVAVCDCK